MDMNLNGKQVLITGASQGIGAALAIAFAQEGCRLMLTARSREKLEKLAAEVGRTYGVAVDLIAADMTVAGTVERIAEQARDIDILVNNAGAIPGGDLWEVDAKRWREGWELKVMGYIDMCRACYANMKQRGGGVILNNIGNGGENYDFNYIAGTTGNAALMAFTRALGGRSLQDGIRVVGMNPGPVATERIKKILQNRAQEQLGDSARYQELLSTMPLGRAASPEEVAALCVFLASPRSAYTTGVIVTLDGGMTSNRSIT